MEILHYQGSASWIKLNHSETKSLSTGLEQLIETFRQKVTVVFTENFDFANRDSSTKLSLISNHRTIGFVRPGRNWWRFVYFCTGWKFLNSTLVEELKLELTVESVWTSCCYKTKSIYWNNWMSTILNQWSLELFFQQHFLLKVKKNMTETSIEDLRSSDTERQYVPSDDESTFPSDFEVLHYQESDAVIEMNGFCGRVYFGKCKVVGWKLDERIQDSS